METRKVFLHFPKCETEKPIVHNLVKEFDLEVNILRAKVTPEEEGYLVLDLAGESEHINKALEYVKTFNVKVNETEKGLIHSRQKCTSCGVCVSHCPVKALHIPNRATMEVRFNADTCVECLQCIEICPFGACSSLF